MKLRETGKRMTVPSWWILSKKRCLIGFILVCLSGMLGGCVPYPMAYGGGIPGYEQIKEKQAIPCYGVLVGMKVVPGQKKEKEPVHGPELFLTCENLPMDMDLLKQLVMEQYVQKIEGDSAEEGITGSGTEETDFVMDLADIKTGPAREEYGFYYEYQKGNVLFSGIVTLKYEWCEQFEWQLVYLGFTDLQERVV